MQGWEEWAASGTTKSALDHQMNGTGTYLCQNTTLQYNNKVIGKTDSTEN